MQVNFLFEEFYSFIYGERWPGLRESLLQPAVSIPYTQGLTKPYMMDYASVLAALSLRLPETGIILDACAAPGGKSLVLASRMGSGTILAANELSADRRRILSGILNECLDAEKRKQVRVYGMDAAKMGSMKREQEKYDAILMDVPCSSERHVIGDAKALSQWTTARPRFLSVRQWSLLSAAFRLLRKGGSLVYSTCSINPAENDGVVRRLFLKYGDQVQIDEPEFAEGEKTEYGRIILPDKCGAGPMYVARLGKNC